MPALVGQLRAACVAGCEAIAVSPSDHLTWLADSMGTRDMMAMAADVGMAIAHLDPLVRWVDA